MTRGLPAPAGRRERIASPEEATRLLAALPPEDRALLATALYAGLRRGELRACASTTLTLRLASYGSSAAGTLSRGD